MYILILNRHGIALITRTKLLKKKLKLLVTDTVGLSIHSLQIEKCRQLPNINTGDINNQEVYIQWLIYTSQRIFFNTHTHTQKKVRLYDIKTADLF